MPFYGTKASNQCLEFDARKSDFFSLERVRKDTGELTLRLLTSRQTEDTLRPMDVLHARGRHSAVPLLDSANNCDREFGRARVSRNSLTTEGRRHGGISDLKSLGKQRRPFLYSSVTPCLGGEKHSNFPFWEDEP